LMSTVMGTQYRGPGDEDVPLRLLPKTVSLFTHSLLTLTLQQSFYVRPRQMAFNAMVADAHMKSSPHPPPYSDVDDFNERGSTKEKAIVQIVQHHLKPENSQGNALLFNKDGSVEVDSRAPVEPIHANPRPTQFVVYSEFVALVPWLVTVSFFSPTGTYF
jgi:nitrous oxide reductase accessory protein NosL